MLFCHSVCSKECSIREITASFHWPTNLEFDKNMIDKHGRSFGRQKSSMESRKGFQRFQGYLPSFEKCNVEDGSVKVDKLEQVHFDGQAIFVSRIRFVVF